MKQLKNQQKCILGRVMRGHVPSLGRLVLLPGHSIFPLCHSERSEESRGGYCLNARLYRQGESGRSMVEMLGVLAVVGVLSVAGIAGYTTAMNKHRANELLQQASLRAVVVSTQIQRGAEAPTLGEFTDNTVGGAKFTGLAAWNKNTDKRFSLTLENVPTDVCTQMKATVGQNSIIRNISQNCTAITYNNDLSTFIIGSECLTTCSNGATCVNGYCECPSGSLWQPSDNSGNGECKGITEGDCKTNANCKKGEYCKIEGSDSTPNKGICETLDNGTEATYKGKTFLYSSNNMTWWAARNWCLAHGMSLVSLSELGITTSDACKESECTGADWEALTAVFGSRWYWTNDHHSRAVLIVSFKAQQVLRNAYPYRYTLCK